MSFNAKSIDRETEKLYLRIKGKIHQNGKKLIIYFQTVRAFI